MTPYDEGARAKGLLENPYWKNYPHPAPGGAAEENAARKFVDGWYDSNRRKSVTGCETAQVTVTARVKPEDENA